MVAEVSRVAMVPHSGKESETLADQKRDPKITNDENTICFKILDTDHEWSFPGTDIRVKGKKYVIESAHGDVVDATSNICWHGGPQKIVTTARKLDFFIQSKKIELNNKLSCNILNFLKDGRPMLYLSNGGRPDPAFSCYDFVGQTAGEFGELHAKTGYHWREEDVVDSADFSPGDAISLYTREMYMMHSALYIGQDKYLSLCGSGGLIVTSLRTMRELYQAFNVRAIYPILSNPASRAKRPGGELNVYVPPSEPSSNVSYAPPREPSKCEFLQHAVKYVAQKVGSCLSRLFS